MRRIAGGFSLAFLGLLIAGGFLQWINFPLGECMTVPILEGEVIQWSSNPCDPLLSILEFVGGMILFVVGVWLADSYNPKIFSKPQRIDTSQVGKIYAQQDAYLRRNLELDFLTQKQQDEAWGEAQKLAEDNKKTKEGNK